MHLFQSQPYLQQRCRMSRALGKFSQQPLHPIPRQADSHSFDYDSIMIYSSWAGNELGPNTWCWKIDPLALHMFKAPSSMVDTGTRIMPNPLTETLRELHNCSRDLHTRSELPTTGLHYESKCLVLLRHPYDLRHPQNRRVGTR